MFDIKLVRWSWTILACSLTATSLWTIGCGPPAGESKPGQTTSESTTPRRGENDRSEEEGEGDSLPSISEAMESHSFPIVDEEDPPEDEPPITSEDTEPAIIAQAPVPETRAPAEPDDEQLAAVGIRRLESKYLTLYTDLPSDPEVDALPQTFDLAFPQWCTYFEIQPAEAAKFHAVGSLINQKERFQRAGLFPDDLPPFPHGFNRGTTLWLYEQPSAYYRRHLLIHEGTHAFMESLLGSAGPPWYREGMAELLATHKWENGTLTLNYFPQDKRETPEWGRVKIIKDEVAANRGMRLADIMRYDRRAHLRNEAYAWCWAITTFFQAHPDSQAAFHELKTTTRTDMRSFNQNYYDKLQPHWTALQEQWQLFVLEMEYGYDLTSNVIERKPTRPLVSGAVSTKISASRGWQSSIVEVEAGRRYKITATGQFQIGQDTDAWVSEPGGITLEYYAGKPIGMLLAAVSPEGKTIQGITPLSQPIEIGLGSELTATTSGTLFFRVNDSPARMSDNAGELEVQIEALDGN